MSGDLRPRRAGAFLLADPDSDEDPDADTDARADGVFSDTRTDCNVERNADMDSNKPGPDFNALAKRLSDAYFAEHSDADHVCDESCPYLDTLLGPSDPQVAHHIPLSVGATVPDKLVDEHRELPSHER